MLTVCLVAVGSQYTGQFLFNNYKQCLKIISDYTLEINKLKSELGISDQTIEGWIEMERRYLKELKAPPDVRVLEIAYVRALLERDQAECALHYPFLSKVVTHLIISARSSPPYAMIGSPHTTASLATRPMFAPQIASRRLVAPHSIKRRSQYRLLET